MTPDQDPGAVPRPRESATETPTRRVQHVQRSGPNTTRARRAPRVLIGRYQLLHRIASGHMSEVYLATDQVLERNVAIKILRTGRAHDPHNVDRFRHEALSLSRIDSPRVVAVHDMYLGGTDEHFLVMRHIIGRTLAQFMEEVGTLAVPHAVRLACEMLDGLSELHTRHLVARDLKPSHVMIDWEDHAVLLALGIAPQRRPQRFPSASPVCGTPFGLDAGSEEDEDDHQDLRQAGLLLLYMLTGVHASATRELSTLTARMPPAIARVLQRALTSEPGSRYASALVMKEALERALREAAPVSTRPAIAQPALTRPMAAPARPAAASVADTERSGAPATSDETNDEAIPTLWVDPNPTVVGRIAR